jgi:hypothetical protein
MLPRDARGCIFAYPRIEVTRACLDVRRNCRAFTFKLTPLRSAGLRATRPYSRLVSVNPLQLKNPRSVG